MPIKIKGKSAHLNTRKRSQVIIASATEQRKTGLKLVANFVFELTFTTSEVVKCLQEVVLGIPSSSNSSSRAKP